MKITIEDGLFADVPVLIARPAGMPSPLPTVLWFHGLAADKDVHRLELCRFAAAGLLAVGVDAVGHGQRRPADLEQAFPESPAANPQLFKGFVKRTVAELPELINRLVACGLADETRIGVAGVSMGACIVYAAIVSEPRIRAAAALLGSPEWGSQGNPEHAAAGFFPTALLSITAEHDTVLPPAAARALHLKLEARYRAHPDRLLYQQIPHASHFMLPDEWSDAVALANAWLVRFLS